MLTVAAFVTAFYTGRQVFLTFAGRPRTEAARHAPESVPSMTWPLIILAIFSTFLGLFGMPWANNFHRLVGQNAQVLGEPIAHGEFNPVVALISITMAGLGWGLAWLVYGRVPLAVPVDPLERRLGVVYKVLKNRYYIDQFYMRFIVRPVVGLARFAFDFDDRFVIDPIVDGVGRAGRWIADFLRRAIDNPIIDGAVNAVGRVTGWAGEFMRATQTGQVQNYLLVAAVTIVLLLALFLVRS
jgi:NADH-quinone oxidoreductase subunit L